MQIYLVLKSGMYSVEGVSSHQTATIAARSSKEAADALAAHPLDDPAWRGECRVWVDTAVVDDPPFWG